MRGPGPSEGGGLETEGGCPRLWGWGRGVKKEGYQVMESWLGREGDQIEEIVGGWS